MTTWVIMVLPVIELYRPGVVVAFESLREVDLVNLTIVNVALYFLVK